MSEEKIPTETPAERLLQRAITPYIAESENQQPTKTGQAVAAILLEMELNS